MRALTGVLDCGITGILWAYYIAGYLLFFSPRYLSAGFSSDRREEAFQALNKKHHKYFFNLLRALAPRVRWHIPEEVASIRSSVIVANHLSFLDPILFVSLFEKQKTIVKPVYFRLPVFGHILKYSGYMAARGNGLYDEDMANQIGSMTSYLAGGGNLFIFPEGHRSRTGLIGPFDKGAFRIAKLCRAPIKAVVIRNTNRLYPPGRFRFNTQQELDIELALAGSFEPDYDSDSFSLSGLMSEVHSAIEQEVSR